MEKLAATENILAVSGTRNLMSVLDYVFQFFLFHWSLGMNVNVVGTPVCMAPSKYDTYKHPQKY